MAMQMAKIPHSMGGDTKQVVGRSSPRVVPQLPCWYCSACGLVLGKTWSHGGSLKVSWCHGFARAKRFGRFGSEGPVTDASKCELLPGCSIAEGEHHQRFQAEHLGRSGRSEAEAEPLESPEVEHWSLADRRECGAKTKAVTFPVDADEK